MKQVGRVLVVGGGSTGCALSILLRRQGISVEMVDIKENLSAGGSGITLQGNALRVLQQLGVWENVHSRGVAFDTLGLRAPDGTLLIELTDDRTGGPDLPATVGMRRPDLAEVLADQARASGTDIRCGLSVATFTQDDEGVDVTFTDGALGRYDLVVGADGIRSSVRAMIGIEDLPTPTGMGIWRVHAARPPEINRTDLIYGGVCYIAGYCPTSANSIYAYLVEGAWDRTSFQSDQMPAIMSELASNYHGPWDTIRDDISDPDRINYTLFESLLVEPPWNRGRIVLLGDAVHACPPTLAQGVAMCLEDATVLAELIESSDAVSQSLFDELANRRFARVREVVEASVQLGAWLLEKRTDADVPGLMGRIASLVTEPA